MARSHPSWSDIEAAAYSDPPSPVASSSYQTYGRPSTWRSNDRDITDQGTQRLDDLIRIWKCPDCDKPISAQYKDFHRQNCQLARDIKEGRASPSLLDPEPRSRKRRLSEVSDTPSHADTNAYASSQSVSPQKKLTKKAAKALEVEERRRLRLEKKARKEREALEAKGRRKKDQPLDVDRQCGVINENSMPCLRSLTCKTHSMGAKRSVPGRSRPYDDLLLEWQKANNPAFLAKLERREEEKAKAMEERRAKKIGKDKKLLKKGMKDARRKDGMRHAADSAALLQEESENDLLPAMDAYLANDGSGHLTEGGALDDPRGKVEVEYKDLLRSLRARLWNDERVISRPVARRSYHGLHTGQARRFLTIRQAFAGGVGGSSSSSSSSSSGFLPVGTNAKAGGPLDGGAAGGFKTPIVAGGGWMFS